MDTRKKTGLRLINLLIALVLFAAWVAQLRPSLAIPAVIVAIGAVVSGFVVMEFFGPHREVTPTRSVGDEAIRALGKQLVSGHTLYQADKWISGSEVRQMLPLHNKAAIDAFALSSEKHVLDLVLIHLTHAPGHKNLAVNRLYSTSSSAEYDVDLPEEDCTINVGPVVLSFENGVASVKLRDTDASTRRDYLTRLEGHTPTRNRSRSGFNTLPN